MLNLLWYVVLVLATIGAAAWIGQNYKQTLFVIALVFFIPIILHLKILEFEIHIFSRLNRHLFTKHGIISKHLKTLTGLQLKHSRLLEDLLESIKSFTGESMAVVIQPAGKIIEFVPESQRELPQNEQTIILMKKISRNKIVEERDKLVGLSDNGRVEALRSSSVAFQITKMQFAGWRNVVDEDGNAVPCDLSQRDAMYDLLPLNIQDELESEFGGGLRLQEVKEAPAADSEAGTANQPE